MINVILFDDNKKANFLPLTYTKPISQLRIGILSIIEKWNYNLKANYSSIGETYLNEVFSTKIEGENNLFINSRFLPNTNLVTQIKNISKNDVLVSNNKQVIAFYENKNTIEKADLNSLINSQLNKNRILLVKEELQIILNYNWDLFLNNEAEIKTDISLLKTDNIYINPDKSNTLIGENIFIERGAKVFGAFLNSTAGPIYIRKNSEVMEGSMIRGPFVLCEGSTIKMGAKIYGATTVGPHSKIGGEVGNSIIQGYTNKGHDGYLGNSVLGEWCNLGADSNTSNLKNNYSEITSYSYAESRMTNTNQQFLGLIMGDHSKCGINTMFNTGTVVGTFCNVFGGDFPEKFISDFSWGYKENWQTHKFEKAIETAKKVMARRNVKLAPNVINMYKNIFNLTNNQI